MSDSDLAQQKDTDEARQRRLAALRSLADRTPPATTTVPTRPAVGASAPVQAELSGGIQRQRPSPTLPPRRLLRPPTTWLAAGMLVLAVVVVTVFALTRPGGTSSVVHTATPAPRTGPLLIQPALDSLSCPTATAWSGDGTRIAVLGTTTCDEQFGQNRLNIYSVPAGKLIAHFRLDEAVQSALRQVNTSGKQGLQFAYTHVLWLGPVVYVTIAVTDSAATNYRTQLPFVGLLRASPGDPQPVAYVQPTSGNLAVFARWSPTTGAVQITHDAIFSPSGNVSATLPPSLAYSWLAGGIPDPLTPLAAGKRPPRDPGGPIGDPSGDVRLAIWQPGVVTHAVLSGIRGAYIFATDFAAITGPSAGAEPFLIDAVHLRGALVPSGHPVPDKASLNALQLSPAPWLPVRDAALQAVMETESGTTVDDPTAHSVAWRPDGAILAAEPNPIINSLGDFLPADITLYDTASGRPLATLRPPAPKGSTDFDMNSLQWTSDGSALLLLDRQSGTLVVWGSTQLPH